MDTIFIVNGFDTTCQALNGMDWDSDIVFSTNNSVLKKKYKSLPCIICVQRNVEKIIPTEADLIKSNLGGMGNQVGTITNRITAMMEVQSHFDKGSEEYEVLQRRIETGQLLQQNEIDKLKGIVAKPMPKYWYDSHKCSDDFQKSICVNKKPYFMIYVYDDYKARYNKYLKESEKTQQITYGEIIEPDKEFLEYKESRNPFGMGPCAMNRICWYIEAQFKGIVSKIKKESVFEYECLKVGADYSSTLRDEIQKLANEYSIAVHENLRNTDYLSREQGNNNRKLVQKYYRREAEKLVPDDDQRYDMILDLYYGNHINRQFCWDVVGEMIVDRVKSLQH